MKNHLAEVSAQLEHDGNLVYMQTFKANDEDHRVYERGHTKAFNQNGVELNRHYSELQPYPLAQGGEDSLVFESRFEGGNLYSAYRVAEQEYNLYLNPDTNSDKHTQWYYFRVSNTMRGASYTFNINNLANKDSQYKYGMRPLMYSMKKNKGWERCGHNIYYFENHVAKTAEQGNYNTLSFRVEFDYDDDEVYFA